MSGVRAVLSLVAVAVLQGCAGGEKAKQTAPSKAHSAAEMHQRNVESVQADPTYEASAIAAYLGDMSVLAECAPEDPPKPKPFTIFIEVLPDGSQGETLYDPLTPGALCFAAKTKARHYPPPKATFVVEIHMEFKE